MTKIPVHQNSVPSGNEFSAEREVWRRETAQDDNLRDVAISFQVQSSKYNYTYQFEWMGVPIIRLPDDIVVLQEIFWALKPAKVVETGIARGGSLLLSASLMQMCSGKADVFGLDLQIFPHTSDAIRSSPVNSFISLWEGDSSSEEARKAVEGFIGSETRPCVLILDSDHTHDHVLAELRSLAPLLPVGSLVLVADTLIEELPEDFYENRQWGPGNNPLSALNQFLAENQNSFEREKSWGRRALQSEFRDGIIVKHA